MLIFSKSIKPTLDRFSPGTTLTARLLTGILFLSFLAKLFLIYKEGAYDRSILQMEYGFGPVITSLYERGSLEACGVPVGLDFCGVATRMPLLPLMYASLAKVIGLQQVHIAIAKTVLFTSLLWLAVIYFSRTLNRYPLHRLALVALSALLFLGPQYLKHAMSIHYEESLLIDLLPAYFLLLGALIVKRRSELPLSGFDHWILVFLLLFGASLYFLKASMLFLGIITILAPLVLLKVPMWMRLFAFLPFLLGLVWWGGVNYNYHGTVRLGSSYNGENFYRGQNAYSYKIYPEIHLDRLIDSSEAILNSGERFTLPNWHLHFPPFKGEWEWHDYFKQLGEQWIKEHPADALAFTLRKVYVFYLEPRKVPFRQSANPATEPQNYNEASLIAGTLWITLLRVLFFAGVIMAIRELWKYRRVDNFALWYFLFIGAYSAPYIVGFGYQRHICPMLIFSSILFFILTLTKEVPRLSKSES